MQLEYNREQCLRCPLGEKDANGQYFCIAEHCIYDPPKSRGLYISDIIEKLYKQYVSSKKE